MNKIIWTPTKHSERWEHYSYTHTYAHITPVKKDRQTWTIGRFHYSEMSWLEHYLELRR